MSNSVTPIFKKCSISDLTPLSEISKRTFEESFAKDNNPDDFNEYIETAFSENRLRSELLNTHSSFYLVFVEIDLVGYFKLNVNMAQAEYKNENAMELERIYVLQEYQGRKIGSYILKKAITIAFAERKEFLWLGVWQKNTKAVKFYEDHGFKKVGTHPYFIGADKQTDWLMRYDLINFNTKYKDEI